MPKREIPHITCEHLYELHGQEKKSHVVIDLRDRLEYESGHIKDSLNIPKKELETNIETLIPEKVHKVVVIVGPTVAILNNEGYSYMLRGDYKRARATLLKAKRKDPKNKFVANNLRLLSQSAKLGKAIE